MGRVSEELGLVALKSSIKGSLNTIAHAGCGFILENVEGKKSTLDCSGKIIVSPWVSDIMKVEFWKLADSCIQKDFRGGRKQETLEIGFSNSDGYKGLEKEELRKRVDRRDGEDLGKSSKLGNKRSNLCVRDNDIN